MKVTNTDMSFIDAPKGDMDGATSSLADKLKGQSLKTSGDMSWEDLSKGFERNVGKATDAGYGTDDSLKKWMQAQFCRDLYDPRNGSSFIKTSSGETYRRNEKGEWWGEDRNGIKYIVKC